MYQPIQSFCENIEKEFPQIPAARKGRLLALTQYIQKKRDKGEPAKIVVICTHNSRRSHLGQIWLAVGADHYGLKDIQMFSGGTEATAFNPRVAAALKRVGFDISFSDQTDENPLCEIKWSEAMRPYKAFSKKYGDAPNPKEKFAALMVCLEADAGCPFVPGADFRLSLPYDDPKAFDGSVLESQKYDESCRQMAREMLYVISKVSTNI